MIFAFLEAIFAIIGLATVLAVAYLWWITINSH